VGNIIQEMALQREGIKGPSDPELMAHAEWLVNHPDSPEYITEVISALLREIARLRIRCRQLRDVRIVR
jgi:hypothetical protein